METAYIETTIFSYLVARPSRDLIVAGRQQLTREWWEKRRPSFACFISDVVLEEARAGDTHQVVLRMDAMKGLPRLPARLEAEGLAEAFLASVLPPKAARDAAHLAIAAVGGVQYLLTWNCTHLANAQVLRQLEPISGSLGVSLPRVCTPEELMGFSVYD
jgi:hypothetical protein